MSSESRESRPEAAAHGITWLLNVIQVFRSKQTCSVKMEPCQMSGISGDFRVERQSQTDICYDNCVTEFEIFARIITGLICVLLTDQISVKIYSPEVSGAHLPGDDIIWNCGERGV